MATAAPPQAEDHDDDDIVFMDEATAEQSLAAKLPGLEAITQACNEATACAEMTEKELALIQEELHKPEVGGTPDRVFKGLGA